MPTQSQREPQPPRRVLPTRAEHVQFDPRPSPAQTGQDATTLTGEEMRRRERGR